MSEEQLLALLKKHIKLDWLNASDGHPDIVGLEEAAAALASQSASPEAVMRDALETARAHLYKYTGGFAANEEENALFLKIENALANISRASLPGIGECTDEMAHAMAGLDGYDHDRDMPTLQRWKDYWDAAVAAAPHLPAPPQTVPMKIVGWFNPWNDYHGFQQVASEFEGQGDIFPLYCHPDDIEKTCLPTGTSVVSRPNQGGGA